MSSHPITPDSTVGDIFDNPSTENLLNVCEILDTEPLNESPIDINISRVIPVNISPRLSWVNFDVAPKKMKITNTGHSVIISGKWGQERPYITNGVLAGKFVFSQMHFHWGANDMEGSEHTIDGRQFPGELHVVLFKSCYLTQEAALKERDGVAILVYILNLQDPLNLRFLPIVDAVPAIAKAHTSAKLPSVPLNSVFDEFEADYFMYKGTVATTNCLHPITWLITRVPIFISPDQMESFRFLLDNDDEIIRRNFRSIQSINNRHIFHILPSSSKYSTLLSSPAVELGDKITQIYNIKLLFQKHLESMEDLVIENFANQTVMSRNRKRRKSLQVLLNEGSSLTDSEITDRTMSVFSQINKYLDII